MMNYKVEFKRSAFIVLSSMSLCLLVFACQPDDKGPLPYYGFHEVDNVTGDTIYSTIRDFTFIDQDSQFVTNATFEDQIYIADFFFTSCPTICPAVKKQMIRIYERFEDNDDVRLLSHTIDVKRDTVGRLKKYAQGLEVDTPKWRFVTGNKDDIYEISYDYMSTALEQPDMPGGFDHSGFVLLIDQNRHIRAYADGTKEEEVTVFMKQIDRLLAETAPKQ